MADLVVNDLALRYGDNDVLRGVTMSVPAGKVVVLLGPAGSGKTAFLRAVAGLETPHRGRIAVADKVLFDRAENIDLPPEARGLGLVPTSHALWPHRTASANVAYGLKLRRIAPDKVKTHVEAVLERIGISDLAEQRAEQLSDSQQRRVALARALAYEPAAVLLDEPFADVDPQARAQTRAWLRELILSLNAPVLIATRDCVEALAIADRIALLITGSVEQQGTPLELYREPATLHAAEFIGANNRLDGTLVELADKRAVIEVMGVRLEGIAHMHASVGDKVTGVIRVEKVMLGGGPGPNRIPMTLRSQMFVGERWEILFVKDALTVRTYVSAPLRHEFYHVEFPPTALWVFGP